MSFFPHFHSIRQDLLQFFSDIENDLGLDYWPSTSYARLPSAGQQSTTNTSQPSTTMTTRQENTQLSNIDFSKPLAANFKIVEENDKLIATGEFPNVRPQDLKISVNNGMLTVDAKRGVTKENKSGGSYSYSASSERFSRTVPLPQGIDSNKVDVQFQDGKLKLILGKTAQSMEQQRLNEKQGTQTATATGTSGQEATNRQGTTA